MATINYKDTKQFLSFVIKGRLFWGEECKKEEAEGKYLMSMMNLGNMRAAEDVGGDKEFKEFKEYRERAHSSNLPELPLITLISLISLILHHDYHHDLISCQKGLGVTST